MSRPFDDFQEERREEFWQVFGVIQTQTGPLIFSLSCIPCTMFANLSEVMTNLVQNPSHATFPRF